MTTIYDVAREAGVSISTVSNVLNRPHKVGTVTRDRVLQVADALGYIPKAEAASLARRSVGRIGVFAPFTSYESYLRRLNGVLEVARAVETEVVVFDYQSAAQLASPVIASVPLQARFDGLIVMGIALDATVEQRLIARGIPAVVVDAKSELLPSVEADDRRAGELAAEHLLSLGHRRIGYVAERQASDYESQSSTRFHAFQAAMGAVPEAELHVVEADPSVDSAKDAGKELLRSEWAPTALVAHFDAMGVGLLRAVREVGLTVPRDVSVMAFDDGPVAEAADMTSVRQLFEESGRVAVHLLQAGIPTAARAVTTLQPELAVRASTGIASAEGGR